jgi:hypothetical protein
MADTTPPTTGTLSWRLSSHPVTLLCYLGFRIGMSFPLHPPSPRPPHPSNPFLPPGSLLMYLFGILFIPNFVLVFILTLLLLSIDFYYLKNIAGRRLVGLRWWNEVNISTGASHWVFESQSTSPTSSAPQNPTDSRFFWLSLYVTPTLWVGLAIFAIIRLQSPIWLVEVVIALVLVLTNTVAFSRCDKFSQASGLAGNVFGGAGIARTLAGGMVGRLFR